MKNKLLSIFLLLWGIVFVGCFEDEGKYDYKQIMSPVWLFDQTVDPIRVTCTEGDTAKFEASKYFRWPSDSLQRAQEVSYEWIIRGKLISNELDFVMLTDELIEKLQMEKFEENGLGGIFSIIDNNTGIKFSVRLYVEICPKYFNGDWLIISENGNGTKCSFMKYKTRKNQSGKSEVYFDLTDNIYKEINGHDIPGRPLAISKSMARNVSSQGSSTIMTDQVAYVLDNTTLKKISEVKDEFLDGVPVDLNIVERRDCDSYDYGGYTFLATKDGRIFRRKTSENYLGGSFLSEPYEIDNKGYKITEFGFAGSGWSNVPCYDEKNNRVIIINFYDVEMGNFWEPDYQLIHTHKLTPVTPLPGADLSNIAPVWAMPEGTEMLFLMYHEMFDLAWNSGQESYTIFYNDVMGDTYMSDFVLNTSTLECVENEKAALTKLPVRWNHETVFLTSIFDNKCKYLLFYSDDNKIYYLNRQENRNEIHSLLTVDSKVTFMGFTTWYSSYKNMIIGCENGDVLVYNIENLSEPRLISRFNVGGRVVDGIEICNAYAFDEIY